MIRLAAASLVALGLLGCSGQDASSTQPALGMLGAAPSGSSEWTLWAGDALGQELMAVYIASLDADGMLYASAEDPVFPAY